jgi:hypothetical protein
MSLLALDVGEEIPMNEAMVWKFPLPYGRPERSLTAQARLRLAEWLMEVARRIQPKDEKANAAS